MVRPPGGTRIRALAVALSLALPAPGWAQSPPSPPESSAVRRNLEANLLVLQVRLDGHVLSDSLDAYMDGRQILLPLGELARLLTLGITVDPEQGSASGFILREDNSFGLNVAETMVSVAGRERFFEARLAKVIDGDIYVSSQLLMHWLPIDLEVDLPTLQLRVTPRERLPLQDRLAREGVGARLGRAGPQGGGLGYPRVRSPFRLAGVPFIDQTFGSQVSRGGGSGQYNATYTAYLAGDLLGMEGTAYVASSSDKPGPDLRLTLGRHDPDGGLLGPLRARSFVAGDIVLPSVSNVMLGSPIGVGVLLSNRLLNQPTTFDQQSLRGDLPPGWDVTLYYNDSLIAYQQSRADGQYTFDNLPLSFGRNEFRLVFNGPLGQVRVERQEFLLDQSAVKPGEFYYSLQQHRADNGDARSVAQVDVGLTRAISANAGLVRAPVAGAAQERAYAQMGVRGYLESMIVSSQLTVAQAGGSLAELGLKTGLGGYSLDFTHNRRLGEFESDLFSRGAAAVRYRDTLRVTGVLKPTGLPALSVTLEADREARTSGMNNFDLLGRVSTLFKGTSVSNSLHWQHLGGSRGVTTGSLQLSRRMIDIGLNAQLDYRLRPAAAPTVLSLTADRNLAAGYRINAGLLRSVDSQTTLLSAGLSKNLGRFGLALNGSYSNQRELTLSVQLFVAMGRDPRGGNWFFDAQPLAGTGAISARAFVDRNLDGVRDAGEEFVPNAGFILNGGGRHPNRTDAKGTTLISRLPPGQYTDVALDPGTLEDPQWRPLSPGVRLLPRPGLVEEIEFPVVSTTDIDGTVYLTAKGKRRGIGDARVEIVDRAGLVVQKTTSSQDGYYLLPQVVPGRYSLRLAPDQAVKLKLGGTLERPLEVPVEGDFINGQDFDLQLLER